MKAPPMHRSDRRTTDIALCTLDNWAGTRRTDRNRLLWAMIPAAALHIVLFALHWPVSEAGAAPAKPERPLLLIREVRLKPPEPPIRRESLESPRAPRRLIPVPEVEVSLVESRQEPPPISEMELPANTQLVYIPDPPPPVEVGPVEMEPDGPMIVSGDVVAAVKIYGPEPAYPRMARLAHIGGSVIVRATINEVGDVVNLRVLRSLPMGLTEATLQAMRRWRYEPATLHGKPVAVYMTLTVNFTVQ